MSRTIASPFKSQRTVSRHDIQVNSLLSFVLASSRRSWKHVCVYRSAKGWVLCAVFCIGSWLFMEVKLWSCHMRVESLTSFSTPVTSASTQNYMIVTKLNITQSWGGKKQNKMCLKPHRYFKSNIKKWKYGNEDLNHQKTSTHWLQEQYWLIMN